jgi:hypothetical protein
VADHLARQSVVDLAMIRAVRLTECAMVGDIGAAIEWLRQHATRLVRVALKPARSAP